MNICFIANFSKTYLFESIGKELSKIGVGVYWITTNENIYQYLSSQTDESKILLINKNNINDENIIIDDFKLNELVYGDRMLRNQPEKGLGFLTNIQQPIYSFLRVNGIRRVFGEITWAHEILIHRICKKRRELMCKFLNPHVVRIPDNRFVFFTDERQSQILEIRNEEKYEWQKLSPKPPKYLSINQKILKNKNSIQGRFSKLKKFMENRKEVDVLDPTLNPHAISRIRKRIQEEIWSKQYQNIKTATYESIKDKPYVFIGLHKQPEASIDVFGRYYEDQLQNIQNLWRALPTGWNLIVKEHSIAIGDRPKSFYEQIQSLPNVFLVDERTPSYPIIKNAELVVTVTGTIAYEAALMGVPSITFAPTFFNQLSLCKQVSLEDLSENNLKEISKGLKERPDNSISFSKFICKNSFDGNILDPVSAPKVMEYENISKVAAAFKKSLFYSYQLLEIRNYGSKAS